MKVLVVGGGGREHALVWKIRQSPLVTRIYCAPGSAAIGELAEIIPIAAEQIQNLADFASKEKIDLTVVGPELPLTLGIADLFESCGLKIFGPSRAAAQLEGSKVFAKKILAENKIPTASSQTFTDSGAARRYVAQQKPPYVIKADGLAGGKGVIICQERAEAEWALDDIMVRKAFGSAGDRLLVEEFLEGEEVSFMVLSDGEHVLPLASSQDHKRVFDNDIGPNTGGMGAYSPARVVTAEMHDRILREILRPLLEGLKQKNIRYRGVIYVGLMITKNGPKVLEFNARFGDPECQPIMMRLKSDLIPLLQSTVDGRLDQVSPEWHSDPTVCVVLTARGYPGAYDKDIEIHGLENLKDWQRGFVFHAGTVKSDHHWFTAGGRVLGVTARGETIGAAAKEAYWAVQQISWDGMHYRKDIARRALN